MTVLERIQSFSAQYGRDVSVNGRSWRYYRLGSGTPIFWLTGGLRRAALGFAFMERLAEHHTIVAPDYPPVGTIAEFMAAFDCILHAEGMDHFALAGQSYGGMLAQAYLADRPEAVDRLILSSSGPADYGLAWLPVEYLCIGLARILPERSVKQLLTGRLLQFVTLPEAERHEWEIALATVLREDLTRADVVSHFAVAADLIRKRLISPSVYQDWAGRVSVLSASNDPTQSKSDLPHYERLFRRPVQVIDMGDMGHTAALFDPDRYVDLLERALA